MLRPIVDAVLLARIRPYEIIAFGEVVEVFALRMGSVSESIPLRAALRVERVFVVVREPWGEGLDLVLEFLAVESRRLGHIQWQVCPSQLARLDFCRCCLYPLWREEVESA